MAKPIAPAKDMAMAFPDVCLTPVPGGSVPIPYPNIAQLGDATDISDGPGKKLLVKGTPVLLDGSSVASSTGNEAGSSNGVKSGTIQGECLVVQASGSVMYAGKGIARVGDQTKQNILGETENTTGFVLSAEPSVMVGD